MLKKYFKKIENKLLKKDNLTENEKKLLERVKNKDIDLIIELLNVLNMDRLRKDWDRFIVF